jgi:hypothetical protein
LVQIWFKRKQRFMGMACFRALILLALACCTAAALDFQHKSERFTRNGKNCADCTADGQGSGREDVARDSLTLLCCTGGDRFADRRAYTVADRIDLRRMEEVNEEQQVKASARNGPSLNVLDFGGGCSLVSLCREGISRLGSDFVAKGDNTTDNTAAFQNALNKAVQTGGGTVYAPPGLYRFAGRLNIAGGVTLQVGRPLLGCLRRSGW